MRMGFWASLKTSLETDLATGNWRTQSYQVQGLARTFHSLDDFMKFYDWVAGKAADETAVAAAGGSSTVAGRTYARPVRDT